MNKKITIVECPRDAMQGWVRMIPPQEKVDYLQALLKVGFHTIDCVSFVSPKAIPQMADSAEVLQQLDLTDTTSKLLAIVANVKGAATAVTFESISYIGYPFSISETFQQLNANSSIAESWERLMQIQELCVLHNKKLVVYISMGFGNPYGDAYDATVIGFWIEKMQQSGIEIISLADTVGIASASMVHKITKVTIDAFPNLEIGVHLHSTSAGFLEKLEAALQAGCTRIDGALKGIGGCPMAQNDLVGNMDTERIEAYLSTKGYDTGLSKNALMEAVLLAGNVFIH
jgi:hydroxymethylglutaryl-CoA lyase